MTVSALVPLTIAISAPFFPLAFLLVTIVYKSPLEKVVLSMERYFPIFSENNSHCLACGF